MESVENTIKEFDKQHKNNFTYEEVKEIITYRDNLHNSERRVLECIIAILIVVLFIELFCIIMLV